MTGHIYTRRGDTGETSLADGTRVPKDSIRVEAYGTIDEANAQIGLVRSALQVYVTEEARLDEVLRFVQHRLSNCAARVATPSPTGPTTPPGISEDDISYLEREIDGFIASAGEVGEFVLPTGCEEASRLHVARTVVRRAERQLVELAQLKPVDPLVLTFINRLSDLLFAAARYANKVYGSGDVAWDPQASYQVESE